MEVNELWELIPHPTLSPTFPDRVYWRHGGANRVRNLLLQTAGSPNAKPRPLPKLHTKPHHPGRTANRVKVLRRKFSEG